MPFYMVPSLTSLTLNCSSSKTVYLSLMAASRIMTLLFVAASSIPSSVVPRPAASALCWQAVQGPPPVPHVLLLLTVHPPGRMLFPCHLCFNNTMKGQRIAPDLYHVYQKINEKQCCPMKIE